VSRERVVALVVDLACVVAFAAAGRGSHEPGASGWVVLAIAWPFALAALLAHAGLLAAGRRSTSLHPGGTTVLAVTYVLGMALRASSGRGLAPGFLVVALVFLVATLLGWRVVRALVRRGGRRPARVLDGGP
jgi:hypothetical protein